MRGHAFGKAQGQKENPGLAKPSQTLRGNEIFDRRICGNITAPCGGLRPMGKQTRRAERVPRERETGNGRVALLRDREEWGMGRFAAVAQERDPPKPKN